MKIKANCPTCNEPLATEYDEGGIYRCMECMTHVRGMIDKIPREI
jgi:ribosomal protein L37AE/L43A